MQRVHSKNTKLRAIVLALTLVTCVAGCVVVQNIQLTAVSRNTRYAPKYSEKAFRAIVVGDSEERVLDLLGEPLERSSGVNDLSRTYLWYAKPIGPSESHLLRNIVIKDGRVTQIYSQIWLD
jgi:hypothetical protein